MAKPYQPRRASFRWLEDAPEYVLDCFDHGSKHVDRWEVWFGGSLLEPVLIKDRKVYFLCMSDHPHHPQGYSQWGEVRADIRPSHRRIRWLDLPEHIRLHVAMRVAQTN